MLKSVTSLVARYVRLLLAIVHWDHIIQLFPLRQHLCSCCRAVSGAEEPENVSILLSSEYSDNNDASQ